MVSIVIDRGRVTISNVSENISKAGQMSDMEGILRFVSAAY